MAPKKTRKTKAQLQEDLDDTIELLRTAYELLRTAYARCAQLEKDVQRISNMYAAIDARVAAMRYALSIIASFDADRWAAHLRAYELQK